MNDKPVNIVLANGTPSTIESICDSYLRRPHTPNAMRCLCAELHMWLLQHDQNAAVGLWVIGQHPGQVLVGIGQDGIAHRRETTGRAPDYSAGLPDGHEIRP